MTRAVTRSQNSEKSPNEMGDKKEGGKSPQKEQQQRTGKGFTFEVVLLDGEHINIELDRNAEGRELFEKVCQHLDLIEKDYFGLQFVDERISNHLKCWLSPDKKIAKQKKRGPWLFDFALKFYPPDPTQLKESLTRWLVVLQTRRDILSGKLPATFLTQAMLGSYCVQADTGDYDPNEHHGIQYIRDVPFAPNQTSELLEKIVELHKQHKGQTPDEAETNFLENAKKLAMYGVDLHAAQDVNNVDLMLGVCASGLQVYQDKLRVSRFVWPKILKLSYKRKHFYIKVRPTENSPVENSVSFKLASHRLAKRLWKICVEHHAFFRLREAEQAQNAAMFPRLGSKFRYSGRTLYQTRQTSQILDRPDPYFERSQPARNTFAAPANHTHGADDPSGRGDHWKDDMGIGSKYRPSDGQDGRDRKDQLADPNATAEAGGREDAALLGQGGAALAPGADGKDRRDHMDGDDDPMLNKEGMEGSMGLTAAELAKKAKEDEKERKRREKEEEKRRKKEEEERKKAEKAAAKKDKKDKGATDPSAEDKTDQMAGGDSTANAPGRTPGSYGDMEGDPMTYEVVAPVGAGTPDHKESGQGKDSSQAGEDGTGQGHHTPGQHGTDTGLKGTDRDKDGKDGDGTDGDESESRGHRAEGTGQAGERGPGKDAADKTHLSPDQEGAEVEAGRWQPGGVLLAAGKDEKDDKGKRGRKESDEDDKDKKGRKGSKKDRKGSDKDDKDANLEDGGKKGRTGSKKDRKGSDKDADREEGEEKDKDKKGKKGSKKDRKGSDKDADREEGEEKGKDKKGKKGSKKDRKGSDKDADREEGEEKGKDKKGSKKDRKGSDKDADNEGGQGKDAGKDGQKDKEAEKDKKGGFFGKFRKPKDSKSKLEEAGGGSGQGPDSQGSAYPGYGPGMGIGAGDMSGVEGEESWIDNKMTFEPVVPAKKETKDSLTGGLEGIDRTMPFFSPAATSTVGRPSKMPPPVPPKTNSFDDSFSRTDVPPTVATESVQYQPDLQEVPVPTKNVPIVHTQTRTVTYERQGFPFDSEEDGLVLVSARSHSSGMQTIETTTFTAERDGIQETRVEHKVVLPSTDDDEFDFDAALADAIRSVTEFNPDMSVERIECVQQIEEVKEK